MTDTGTIFNIMRFAVHDGPGIRTTVFLKGCPLSCLWCHNPESMACAPQLMYWENRCMDCGECRRVCRHSSCVACGACARACPTGARELSGRRVTVSDLMREVEKDTVFYDKSGGGVTFSGGEPLQQPDFLQSLLAACRKKMIHTAVDTTGYADTAVLLKTAALTDLFLYDLKLMDDRRHRQYCGVSNQRILANLQELAVVHRDIRIRVPLIPGINDDPAHLEQLGSFIAPLEGVSQVHLLPYQPLGADKYLRLKKDYALAELVPPEPAVLDEAASILRKYGLSVLIGG
jgi:pyruvate formate lyase activating enzyme